MQQPIVAALHFTVHEGGLAEFRRQADAIRQQVDDTEEGVLFHAWYHDPASGEVTLLDIYRDSATLVAHAAAARATLPGLLTVAIDVYGDPSPEARAALAGQPVTFADPLTGFMR